MLLFFCGRFNWSRQTSLSKGLYTTCDNLLLGKLRAYGVGEEAIDFLHSYLPGRKQRVFNRGLIGVDKHLFQRVSLIISMTLPLNYIFVLLLVNVDVIPKQKQLSTV